ncbi:MAG TPA: hypothetical protein VGV59_02475 [Pyrinomonadaceae bacterium]|nr:hypothetical protein [Pyrinomonadaceae bacterium]
MKLMRLFLPLALMLAAAHVSSGIVRAQSASTSDSLIYGGKIYSHKASEWDLANAPLWNPAREDPPLSMRKAVELARESLRRYVKKPDDMSLERIELKQLGVDKWIYMVAFYCWEGTCEDEAGRYFRIYLRMDGSVIEPESKPVPAQKN